MNDRFGTSLRPARSGRHWLGALVGLVVLMLASNALAQGRSGPLIVLGLRAPDGDDTAAQNMTTALRSVARAGGFSVPNDSPALEQAMAMYSCDESLPPACLRQIAADQNHQRVMYGTVRRHGSGRNAPLLIEVSYYDPTTDRENEGPPVEIAPAAASDNVQLNAGAQRILDGLFPVAATPVNPSPNSHGDHGHNNNGNMVDTSPTPIRRYVGYGAAGVGLVLGIIGVVEGVMWFNLQSQVTTPAAGQPDTQWTAYNRGGTFEDTCARAATDNSPNGMYAASVCAQSGSLSAGAWAFATAGVVLIAVGAVLYITDSSGSPTPSADNDDGEAPRRARRTAPRVRFSGAPVISPTFGGAAIQVTF